MHFTLATVILAATAMASPAMLSQTDRCPQPGEYKCSADRAYIEVCDQQHNWEINGACEQNEVCRNVGGTPHCVDRNQNIMGKNDKCRHPGEYKCSSDNKSIEVCDQERNWEFNGACSRDETCRYIQGTPYCVDKNRNKNLMGENDKCRRPGEYKCSSDRRSIEVCDQQHNWEFNGECAQDETCRYNPDNKQPYCTSSNRY